MAQAITSERQQARDNGERTYFTGRPCKHGHVALRFVSTGNCLACRPGIDATHARKNARKMYEWNRRYRLAHLPVFAAHTAKRRAAILLRTPPWADLAAIAAIYEEAARASETDFEKWHVDHIVPLQGRRVSGLHVRENLQLLPAPDNHRKNNKFETTT